MAEAGDNSGGFFGTLRRLFETVLATLQNRGELLALELQEEKYRFVELLVLVGIALFFGAIGLALLIAVVIFLFPENWRLGVAAALSGLCLLGAGFVGLRLKQRLKQQPFEASIEQLRKDWECLKPPP